MYTITIEKTVYNFDELSDSAKQAAIYKYLANVEAIFSGWLRDMEYEETEEYFSELAEINGFQFDEFGNIVSETVPF